jgi:transposase InsO family protein
MVVGWSLSSSLSAEMVLTALGRGIRNRRPGPGLIIHYWIAVFSMPAMIFEKY